MEIRCWQINKIVIKFEWLENVWVKYITFLLVADIAIWNSTCGLLLTKLSNEEPISANKNGGIWLNIERLSQMQL